MAGTITHYWNGSVLTVTSDSGTSSADLSGATGPRGPQGRPGVIYDSDGNLYLDDIPSGEEVEALADRMTRLENSHGVTTEYVATKIEAELADYYTKEQTDAKLKNIDVDLSEYATIKYVDNAIANAPGGGGSVDLSDYATKAYVNNAVANVEADVDLTNYTTFDDVSAAIAQAQLGGTGDGEGVDLSAFATKTYVNDLADGDTIVYKNGHISTAFGGKVIGHEGGQPLGKGAPLMATASNGLDGDYTGGDLFLYTYSSNILRPETNKYNVNIYINGESHTIENIPYGTKMFEVYGDPLIYGISIFCMGPSTMVQLYVNDPSLNWVGGMVESITFTSGLVNVYEPIDANALPMDTEYFSIYQGKVQLNPSYAVTWEGVSEEIALQLENAGGGSGGNVDLSNYYTKKEVDAKIADAGAVDLTNYYTKAQVQAYVLEQRNAIENWVLEQIAASGGSAPSSEEVEY